MCSVTFYFICGVGRCCLLDAQVTNGSVVPAPDTAAAADGKCGQLVELKISEETEVLAVLFCPP
jgi:hypothetical protein